MKTLASLLRQVPTEVGNEVVRVVERMRGPIRDALRAECRLALNPSIDEGQEAGARVQVPVSVESVIPVWLEAMPLPDGYERVLALLPHVEALRVIAEQGAGLVDASTALLSIPGEFPPALPDSAGAHLVVRWAQDAVAAIDAFDPLKAILKVDEDVLGAYWFSDEGTREAAQAHIHLYWMAIGFIAKQSGMEVQDLTIVALTHELAHAYTHLGADIDAKRWDTAHYARAMPALAESLAQYYTWRALMRLRRRAPGAIRAFHRLIPHQHEIYCLHEEWAEHVPIEAVRQALLEVRRSGFTTLDEFKRCLEGAVDRVPGHRQPVVDVDPLESY